MSPAFVAAQFGRTLALKALIAAGCDVNRAKKNGTTPAYIASQEGHTEALKALIAAHCDVNQSRLCTHTTVTVALRSSFTGSRQCRGSPGHFYSTTHRLDAGLCRVAKRTHGTLTVSM